MRLEVEKSGLGEHTLLETRKERSMRSGREGDDQRERWSARERKIREGKEKAHLELNISSLPSRYDTSLSQA